MAKAKKFAAVVGLHNIYEVGTRTIDEERVSYYIIENPQAEDLINHNTICFLTADKQDAGIYITDHIIKENDKFIIVQNDVFSLYGSTEKSGDEPTDPDKWRPIYVNGQSVLDIDYGGWDELLNRDEYTYDYGEYTITVFRARDEETQEYIYTKIVDDKDPNSESGVVEESNEEEFGNVRSDVLNAYEMVYVQEPFSINYKGGNYTYVSSEYDLSLKQLSVKYNFSIDDAIPYIQERSLKYFQENSLEYFQENLNFTPDQPELPIFDGLLTIETPNEEVHTDNPIPRDDEETEEVESVITGTASIKPNTIDVEGSFSANSADDKVITIHYKGNADRVDWYAEGDTRNESDPNESTAKKFVYIECMQEYFNSRQDYPYIELNDKGKQIISEDSIVFITCGTLKKETAQEIRYITDAEAFGNPEYMPGARFIWTHNKMFSANTWMPIFTRETEQHKLNGITPIIGSTPYGGRLIFQGAGGIKVDNTINDDNTTGTHDRIITIDGSGIQGGTGEGGTIYDTDVFIKSDILLGGTLLGDNALSENLFGGNKVPAGMNLHDVLMRLLYKEAPIIPFYIGTIGLSSVQHFEEDADITSFVTGHVYFGTDIPSDATVAFRKYSERIVNGYTKQFVPSNEFQMANGQVPAELQEPSQLVILAPKSSFNTAEIVGNNWLEIKDPIWGDWTNEGQNEQGGEKAYWRSRVIIDGVDYYIWYLHPTLDSDQIYSSNVFNIKFFTHQ